MKIYDTIETGINAAGIAISITDLNQVLNMVVLCVSVASILFKAGFAIYKHVKAKNFEDAMVVVEDATEQLEDLKGKIEDGRNQESDRNG